MTDNTLAIPTVAASQGNVDVSQVTNPATSGAVLREKIVVADPNNFAGQAQTTNARGLMVDDQLKDMMQEILIELRVISQLLQQGLTINDDLELLRADPSLQQRLQQ